jgi:hypothetical protein
MKHLLIKNSTAAVTAGTNESALPANVVAAVDASTNQVVTSASTNFYIVQTDANADIVFRTPILESDNVELIKTVGHVPANAQTTGIDLSGFTPTAKEEYTVKVVDVTNGYEPYPVQTVSVLAPDNTAAALVTALVTAFNANTRALVTASATGGGTTLTLTGSLPILSAQEGLHTDGGSIAQSFRTSISETFGPDVEPVATAAPTFGTGNYEQVRYLEENSQAGQGFLYRATPFRPDKPVFYSDSTKNYDITTILYRTNTTPNIAKSNKYVEYVIAFEDGGSAVIS